jgi:hypothetical protein
MAYGQNKPGGLLSLMDTISGIYNGQTGKYYIQSGYQFNIFRGDLVYLGSDGFIHNLYDVGAPGVNGYTQAQALGVFNGASYVQPFANNPIDPASPGRSYWPAGTVTANGAPATCFIIEDPNVVYTIQVSGSAAWNAQSRYASVAYTDPTTGYGAPGPLGDTQTGQSSMVLNSATFGNNPLFNLRVIGFDDNPTQTLPVAPSINPVRAAGAPVPFINVRVLIQNHSYVTRPTAVA